MLCGFDSRVGCPLSGPASSVFTTQCTHQQPLDFLDLQDLPDPLDLQCATPADTKSNFWLSELQGQSPPMFEWLPSLVAGTLTVLLLACVLAVLSLACTPAVLSSGFSPVPLPPGFSPAPQPPAPSPAPLLLFSRPALLLPAMCMKLHSLVPSPVLLLLDSSPGCSLCHSQPPGHPPEGLCLRGQPPGHPPERSCLCCHSPGWPPWGFSLHRQSPGWPLSLGCHPPSLSVPCSCLRSPLG